MLAAIFLVTVVAVALTIHRAVMYARKNDDDDAPLS